MGRSLIRVDRQDGNVEAYRLYDTYNVLVVNSVYTNNIVRQQDLIYCLAHII